MISAACPVGGCGRELPIDPSLGYDTYTCPCPRRELLDVGLTRDKRYVLRSHRPNADAKHEINLIAHALVTGQARDHAQPTKRRPDTGADPASAGMFRAHMAAHRLYREAANLAYAGQHKKATLVTDRARAAERAYDLHAARYARATAEETHEAVWHSAERFYIEKLSTKVVSRARKLAAPALRLTALQLTTFTFPFLALWDEEKGVWDVANSGVLEVVSGLEVGEEGWRDLMGLLVYLRGETVNGEDSGKRGKKADERHLIYRTNGVQIRPRLFIAKRFPRALIALEAVRRSLSLEQPKAKKQALPQWARSVEDQPDWANAQVVDRQRRSRVKARVDCPPS